MYLSCVSSLSSFRSKLDFLRIFKVTPKSGKSLCTIVHGFIQKWLQIHQKFLLHFLIHIDVLMLCSKFELILTSFFQVTAIL